MSERVYVPNELLSRLVGFRLISVSFVHDYLQLGFEGETESPVLTCDVTPVVVTAAGGFSDGQPGYSDALRSLVSDYVVRTEEAVGVGLRIELGRGSIVLHPAEEELVGPEIALLKGFDDGRWMCWRPGEDSFEDLG
ncbi:hypothetical protein I6A60_29200 [Frankia sp. AgB1.9]|uniref:hypothetical protein n=1 Tax=unclassified Frankia TaxID=2632575 RepID=UPI0019339156|nr:MULTISPECIES: hypothetical protein [unclassified Frankia]MBL7490057.1 hypothetical protein [Frankia sp. AgW1.1]MBL7551906.1 hypothetical protein [Frankia sp. AgB1.9]MBL7624047.1 hypothetical protein [Frankia sp. AgB1.8]